MLNLHRLSLADPCMLIEMELFAALKQYWGYDSLRPLQGDIVEAALAARDALVVMPTGAGRAYASSFRPSWMTA